MKTCTGCLCELELSAFGRYGAAADGLRHKCRSCNNAESAAYARRNAERVKAKRAEAYKAAAAAVLARCKTYRLENKDAIRLRRSAGYKRNKLRRDFASRAWKARNVGRWKQIMAACKKRNPATHVAAQSRRRARQRQAEGRFEAGDVKALHDLQGGRCVACRIELAGLGHVDHIKALACGGSNWPSNLQLLCKPCNSSKGRRDNVEFMQSRGIPL